MADKTWSLLLDAELFTPISSPGFASSWQSRLFSPGAMVFDESGIIAVGEQAAIEEKWPRSQAAQVISAAGRLVTPGFVDCHTHPVFHNLRAHEFTMRIQGATYVEISKAGGGIRYSVRDLQQASEEQLLSALLPRLDRFIANGTTTIEAKSGYGLSVEAELKSLRVLQRAAVQHPVDIVPTFLGAHEVPDAYRGRRQAYLDLVIEEMLPRVVEEGLATFIDVFCEDHVFTAAESRAVLEAGQKAGLAAKIHADQLHDNGGAAVAADVGAVSADHLEHTPEHMDSRLLAAQVVPVMLPGADFFLSSPIYGPARRMIEAGLPVALATDFNPGTCMSESMPMMLTLAGLQMRMTPEETLIAATLHAAMAISAHDRVGSLENGKQADFVIWDARSPAELPYHFGVQLVQSVYKKGRLAFQASAARERT